MIKKILNNKKLLIVLGVVLILLVIIIVIIISGGNIVGIIKNSDGVKIQQSFEELNNKVSIDEREYPKVDISSDNILKYIDSSEILNIIDNKEDAVIYFGTPTCIYCRNAIQVLIDTAVETKLDVIYYFNNNESDTNYSELVNVLGEELTMEENGVRKVYIPLVIFITDGKVVSYNKGTLFSQEDPYVPLDDSQRQGLSEIYKYGINDVISSKNSKNK